MEIFFIKNNYSMTLGHQEHHQIVLHLAQMHYYAIYTAFFVCSHLVSLSYKGSNEELRRINTNTKNRIEIK
jgi:hypothetical protein